MNTEYQWWLLAVFLAAAGGILWLLRGSLPRREVDLSDDERTSEAAWIASELRADGEDVSEAAVVRALELHRSYLEAPPPPPPPAVADEDLVADPYEQPAAATSAARRESV